MSESPSSQGSPSFTIRRAESQELHRVADVIVASYKSSFDVSDYYESDMRRLDEHAEHYIVWVAVDENDGALLGAVLTPRPDVPYVGQGEPDDERGFRLLAVDPAARGKGVGTALIAHAVEQIAALGVSRVGIWTGPQMEGAVHLYESLGFVRHPERETFTVDGGKVPISFTLDIAQGLTRRRRARPARPGHGPERGPADQPPPVRRHKGS